MAGRFALLVTIAFCISGTVAVSWKNLHVKYAALNGFYNIPLTVNKILKEKFVKMAHDADLNVDLYALPGDPRVSILFDTYGNIAGIRTAYIKDDVAKRAVSKGLTFEYTYDDKPIFTSGRYFETDVWYTSVLFAHPDTLKAGGRQNTNDDVAEDMYMKLEGVWTKIPRDECEAESVGFTKQSCFIGMGMHYFYKVTPQLNCKNFEGAFLLYESGELIGLGFNPFGSFTSKNRIWFEEIPPNVVTKIVTNGPPCVKDWVANYGATALHIFFKKNPRLTFCTWPWQKKDQCKPKHPNRMK